MVMLALIAVGCCSPGASETRRRSSAAEYLHPDDQDLTERATIPRMELPLTVGIAFVPEARKVSRFASVIDEAAERDLLEQVAAVAGWFALAPPRRLSLRAPLESARHVPS